MKKLFIGLLVVAAGAAAFYYFNQKSGSKPSQDTLNKELIIGKWKTNAVMPNDSGFNKYSYHFQKEGGLLRSLSDTVKADTLHFEWSKDNELAWKKNKIDSIGIYYSVVKLTPDSLLVQSKDSATVLFTKVK